MSKPLLSEVIKGKFPLLAQYTPILARVHGENHPELAQVRDIFAEMDSKVQREGEDKADLTAEFDELRKLTGNYSVPGDGCETYHAVYQMLEAADRAYHS